MQIGKNEYGAVYSKDNSPNEIELDLKQAAMTMQIAVLAVAEWELGTCWVTGINHKRVEIEYKMPDDAKLIAISTLGRPIPKKRLSWDFLAYHLVSKRRKPLESIWIDQYWKE